MSEYEDARAWLDARCEAAKLFSEASIKFAKAIRAELDRRGEEIERLTAERETLLQTCDNLDGHKNKAQALADARGRVLEQVRRWLLDESISPEYWNGQISQLLRSEGLSEEGK